MIERIPFGRTGHRSSRAIFGAAALAAMKPERAEQTLELLPRFGVNHIDVAASYGDAELRLAPWLRGRRADYFVATKTQCRTGDRARAELERSLERMEIDRVDLIQLHNLTQGDQWEVAMAPGGALEALLRARDEGLARFIGVTGHGSYAASMHRKSLERFDFDSVLLPYNFAMMSEPRYAAEFEALHALCRERQVAMQTIKSVAQRRWREGDEEKRFSWYRPIRRAAALKRAVDFVLARPGLFLNTSSDATLLPAILGAASEPVEAPDVHALEADRAELGIEPLFVRDFCDDVVVATP